MEFSQYFKSIIEQDECAIVICNLQHEIIYMNHSAIERYAKRGGAALVGNSILNCHNEHSNEMIKKVVGWFMADQTHNKIFTHHNDKENKDVYMVALRNDDNSLIGYYEKHEYRNVETVGVYKGI